MEKIKKNAVNGNRRNMRGRKEVKGPGKKKSSFNIYQDIQETETQKITFIQDCRHEERKR